MVKRCLIISYYFPPFGGGGVQRISKLVKHLSRKEWECHVITAGSDISNLPKDNSLLEEIPESVKIDRLSGFNLLKKTPIRSSFIVRWLVSLFFIPDIRRKWIKQIKPLIYKKINQQQFSLILLSVPPYSLALLAMQLKNELKIPVILDMRDAWTRDPLKIYPTFIHKFYDSYLEKKTINSLDTIISVYQSTITQLKLKNNNKKQCFFLIPNGYDEEDIDQVKKVKLNPEFFHIALSGTLYSHLNNLKFLFSAFQKIKNKEPEIFRKIRFHHIGHSQINLDKIIKKYGCEEIVEIWGYKSHQECLSILSAADVCCIIFDSKINYAANVIGGKVYEYMALKKPVLALVPEKGETADLINSTQSGKVIDPYSTEIIAETLTDWIKKREFSDYTFKNIDEYARKNQADLFMNIFENIINKDNS